MTKIKKHQDIDVAVKTIADWRCMMVVHALYEHGPIRYKELSTMLEFSPTVLSQKLALLTELGVITRHQTPGIKEVTYHLQPVATHMVQAFHLLESVNEELQKG
ncbi:MarR family transcriptional regulator [Candidatus Saccharibacteria bacterium]|nr:MarR family transcriptional regulator [Candidatus Saccharibacteria bacterium]